MNEKILLIAFKNNWKWGILCFVWCAKTGSDTHRRSRTDAYVWDSPGVWSDWGATLPRDLEVILTTPSALLKSSNSWSSVIFWGILWNEPTFVLSYNRPVFWSLYLFFLVGWGSHPSIFSMSLLSICLQFVCNLSAKKPFVRKCPHGFWGQVTDITWGLRNHNPELYQLSHARH